MSMFIFGFVAGILATLLFIMIGMRAVNDLLDE